MDNMVSPLEVFLIDELGYSTDVTTVISSLMGSLDLTPSMTTLVSSMVISVSPFP